MDLVTCSHTNNLAEFGSIRVSQVFDSFLDNIFKNHQSHSIESRGGGAKEKKWTNEQIKEVDRKFV